MRRFKLAKKFSKFLFFKILAGIGLISILGFYSYNYFYKSKHSSKSSVLAVSKGPIKLNPIDTYILKNTLPPQCDDIQSYMDFTCYVSSTKSVIKRGNPYYGNPVLESINNIPVLFYHGGIHEVVLDTESKVVTLSQTYKTVATDPTTKLSRYTNGCMTGWFPSGVVRKGNQIFFGSGGLESLDYNRCYGGPLPDVNAGLDGFKCANMAKAQNIALIAGCTPTSTNSCWDKRYECTTLFGGSQYYNYPAATTLTFSEKSAPDSNGSVLDVKGTGFLGSSSGGPGVRDFYTFCFGKTKDGGCTIPFTYKNYGVDTVEIYNGYNVAGKYFANRAPQSGMVGPLYSITTYLDWLGRWRNNPNKFFEKRVRYGANPLNQQNGTHEWFYGGYDSPLSSFNLGANRVDLFYITPDWRTPNQYFKKTRLNIYYIADPLPEISEYSLNSGLWDKTNTVIQGVLADFVSDKYFYTLQYLNGTLFFKRFGITGLGTTNITSYRAISMPNVKLNYTKNISFNITSGDDIDIMVAPNYYESESIPTAETKMFRAKYFNSSDTNMAYQLYELDGTHGGYIFSSPGKGNNVPLTFKYYNTTDNDPTNDLAIFVSRNYVYTSDIPKDSEDCYITLNNDTPYITNTNPNSINKGVSLKGYNAESSPVYDLKFGLNTPLALVCPTQTINIPAGTQINLDLYDGLSSEPLAELTGDGPYTSVLNPGGKSFSFPDLSFNPAKKYYYTLSFDYSDVTYYLPSAAPTPSSYYTLEGGLNVNFYSDNINPDTFSPDPFTGAKLTIKKTLGSLIKTYYVAGNTSSSSFPLDSLSFSNFFWDHNLLSGPSGVIDQVNYNICVSNTTKSSITKVGLDGFTSPSYVVNSNASARINGKCVDFKYRSPGINDYGYLEYGFTPESLDLYINASGYVTPVSYNNFEINGNAYSKIYTSDSIITSLPNKTLEGILISADQGGSSIKYSPMATFKFNFPSSLPAALYGFINNTTYDKFFNFAGGSATVDASPLSAANYTALPSLSNNSYEIIALSQGKGIKFDLNNTNISKTIDKYIILNLDPKNLSRIQFYMDCNLDTYSNICSGGEFFMKGIIAGPFSLKGNVPTLLSSNKFVNITENPTLMLKVMGDLKKSKYQLITKTKLNLKYSQ